jgi:hypothetical protein
MNLSEILRYAFLGSVVYGAYKLGEKNGKSMNQNDGYIPDSKRYSEEEYIMDEIEALKRKPNKTRKDRDNLSLLEIKLQQLYKFR